LPVIAESRTVLALEVHVSPATAKKLKDLSATSGRAPEDIVEDALAGYLEEVASIRNTLESRYDDLKAVE
jgi:predicted transcriptional regulator